MSYINGMSCTHCGQNFEYEFPLNLCPECDGTLFITYDYEEIKNNLSKRKLRARRPGVWKYSEFLPNFDQKYLVSLGEGGTYLHRSERLADEIGLKELYLKDETTNPTGSFLDRGMTIEVSAAKRWGLRAIHNTSLHAANMSASLVAYAARAGIRGKTFLGLKGNIDMGKFHQILAYAADIEIVRDEDEAAAKSEAARKTSHCVSPSNPHFIEGKKTTVVEVYEQLNWTSPDWILAPMGTGGHVSAIWKGINELGVTGFIEDDYPRIIGTQAEGCAPIIKAYQRGSDDIIPADSIFTLALPIAMKNPICGKNALNAIAESSGMGTAVTNNEIIDAITLLARLEGVYAEPISATTIAVLRKLVAQGKIHRDEKVVCMITGAGLKYPNISRTLVKGKGDLEQLLNRIEQRRFTTELGQTKVQILRFLSGGESYGYEIWKRLRDELGIVLKKPGVYQHLSDLVSSGLVIKTSSNQVLKRTRNYYDLSEKGRWILIQLEKLEE